ncbi:MAG: large subunit ribosomal protein L12 [Candidatus Argoarchaeum ethanivorans]|uniref:Large ribosomal subunit protein P1 n=1 Tax=Candidatus Argoarchaeum ethanivorans TaxID=2608793 RepID=A0A8B3S6L9_9EURY|nr:MAG: large subunit ribosomal protein L12 [Candidatus Argoarchaeum ethanivorans]
MEYIYAALLLHKAGKEITEENVSAVVSAAGLEVDAIRIKALVATLDGVNIDEAISKSVVAAPTAATTTTTQAEAPPEEVKEEKTEEEEEEAEESGMEGLGALFG